MLGTPSPARVCWRPTASLFRTAFLVHAFHRFARIREQAKQLLRYLHLRGWEIAFEASCRVFKRIHVQSPLDYREQLPPG
jgi:hypothetical protein